MWVCVVSKATDTQSLCLNGKISQLVFKQKSWRREGHLWLTMNDKILQSTYHQPVTLISFCISLWFQFLWNLRPRKCKWENVFRSMACKCMSEKRILLWASQSWGHWPACSYQHMDMQDNGDPLGSVRFKSCGGHAWNTNTKHCRIV